MASEEILKLFKIEKLKEEQSAILKCIIEGRDCMAVLPTGFGKSLPYQMAVVQQKMKCEENCGMLSVYSTHEGPG